MSTGLMSCVRENTPPLDSEMQAEITTMSLPSEYSEPQNQKRRRFNALKNLRRIFRRRTVASAETLPGKIRSHIAPGELADSHFRDSDSVGAYKQPSLVSIRSTKDERDYEGRDRSSYSGRNVSCSIEYARGISGSGNGHISSTRTRQLEDYPFDDVARRRDRSQPKPAVPSDRLIQRHYEDWNGSAAHKRSHSEDRLKEGVPLDQEISKSHESVFREPATDMAMLTIGLKTELIDVLRKRRSRPETYENNLETTTVSPKRSSAEMYDLRNTLPSRRAVDPDAQVRLVGSNDVPDLTALPQSHMKMSEDQEYTPSSGLLSHSAARHKMAVRPKKKGPTRYRRSMDSEENTAGMESSQYEHKSDLEYRESTIRQISEERPKTTSSTVFESNSAATPLSSRVVRDRPKTMEQIGSGNSVIHPGNVVDRHSTANSPPKPSFTFFEGKPSNRTCYSNLTKSEEYLQGTGKDHNSYGPTNCGEQKESKPSSTVAAAAPCLQHISAGRRKSVEKSQSFKIFSHPPSQPSLDSVSDRKELFNMNRPVSYKEFSKSGHAFDSPKPAARSNINMLTATKHTVDSILPIVKTNNIIQIEENIDKLVSSPFVPSSLLKNSGATEESGKSKNNVSITNIGPEAEITRSAEEKLPFKSPGVNLRRRSSSNMEKSPSVGSLNTLGSEECKIPEFLRVHLNRVENARPKSSIVFRGTSDTLPRRYSRDLDNTKPPLPPVLNVSTLKRPSINKSQETITESNHVIIVPVNSSRKASLESVTEPLPVTAEPKINSRPDCVSGEKLVDEFSERKGSVSEEKAKIERRLSIADEKSIIRKKSIPSSQTNLKGSNKEDNTPELMKVFARRSMKLKDDDDELVHKSESQSSMVTDSDKENQSSSHEELSIDSKVEEDTAAREPKTIGDSSSYRPRTFLEVKNMLQSSTNNNGNKPALLRTQRVSIVNDPGSMLTVRDGVPDPADSDKLPEFKRILERRAEWESRAKMWK